MSGYMHQSISIETDRLWWSLAWIVAHRGQAHLFQQARNRVLTSHSGAVLPLLAHPRAVRFRCCLANMETHDSGCSRCFSPHGAELQRVTEMGSIRHCRGWSQRLLRSVVACCCSRWWSCSASYGRLIGLSCLTEAAGCWSCVQLSLYSMSRVRIDIETPTLHPHL